MKHGEREDMSLHRPVLLVFELRRLGDAVLSLPFVRGAQAAYEVHVVCAPSSLAIFEGTVPADNLLTWNPPWLRTAGPSAASRDKECGMVAMVRRLRAVNPEVAVCAWADPRTHVVMALSHSPVRIGFPMTAANLLASHRPWRRRQILAGKAITAVAQAALRRRLLTTALGRKDRQHHLESWRQVAAQLDIELDTTTPWVAAATDIAGMHADLVSLLSHARESGLPVWLVHAGARQPCRRWPAEKFAAIIHDTFVRQKIPVIIVKAPGVSLPVAPGPYRAVVETPSIHQLIAIMDRADLVLCNDSLAAHLSAALGKRVVSIFTSGDSDWFAPVGSQDLVIETHVCSDRPCVDRCTRASYICLEAITVKAVADRVTHATREYRKPDAGGPQA